MEGMDQYNVIITAVLVDWSQQTKTTLRPTGNVPVLTTARTRLADLHLSIPPERRGLPSNPVKH